MHLNQLDYEQGEFVKGRERDKHKEKIEIVLGLKKATYWLCIVLPN